MPASPDELPIVEPVDFPQQENETAPGQFIGVCERTGNSVVRQFRVPWELKDDYTLQILGYAFTDPSFPGVLFRSLPYRDYKNRKSVAVRCELAGQCYRGADVDETGTLAPMVSAKKYRYAILNVTFSTVPYDLGDQSDPTSQIGDQPAYETDRFAYKSTRPGIEFQLMEPGRFCLEASGSTPGTVKDGEQILTRLPELLTADEIVVTLFDWPRDAFPDDAIQACMGRVNVDWAHLPTFPPPGEYEAETLLLTGYQTKQTWFPNDLPACDITYFFKRRKAPIYDVNGNLAGYAGFNHYLKQDGTWGRIRRKSQTDTTTSKGLYLTADFNRLFIPGG